MSVSRDPLHPSRLDDRKLDSWKEIAYSLDREVRAVQRWEKTENLPVHRHEHQKKSTVYAFTSELDDWRKNRQPKDDPDADAAFVPELDTADAVAESGNGGANLLARFPVEEDKSGDSHVQVAPPAPKLKHIFVAIAAILILVAA